MIDEAASRAWLDAVCDELGGVRDVAQLLIRHVALCVDSNAATHAALVHGARGAGKTALARALTRSAPAPLRTAWLAGATLATASAEYGGAERALVRALSLIHI